MKDNNERINKNYFLSCVKDGKVVASYYTNSLHAIPYLRALHKVDEIEAFDVKKYGFAFGEAPVIHVEGGRISGIRCRESGKFWRSAKECCKAISVPLKTLYTAIRRGSRIFGYHYEYYDIEQCE